MRELLVALFVISLVVVGCSQNKERPPGQVGMTDGHDFDPTTITIQSGDTVTWINDSSEFHTVTALEDPLPEGGPYFASGGADSEEEARDAIGDGLLKPEETFKVTYQTPGMYRYVCIPHESHGMTGTVVVE